MWESGLQALWAEWDDMETGWAGAMNQGAGPSPGSTWQAGRTGTGEEPTPRVRVPDQVCNGQRRGSRPWALGEVFRLRWVGE